jgi:hypothetical protein
VKCPECVKQGLTSRVYDNGSLCTLMGGGETFYDEAGERHRHDPNRVTNGWYCSNQHYFSQVTGFSCPNRKCGWRSPWETKVYAGGDGTEPQ